MQYVAQNFTSIIEEIREWFPVLRETIKGKLTAGRLIDGTIFLALTGKILAEYGARIGMLSAEECEPTYGSRSSFVIQALKRSEDSFSELDPVKFYLAALFETVDSDSERIARDKESFCLDPTLLGYEHNGSWHVWPDRALLL